MIHIFLLESKQFSRSEKYTSLHSIGCYYYNPMISGRAIVPSVEGRRFGSPVESEKT